MAPFYPGTRELGWAQNGLPVCVGKPPSRPCGEAVGVGSQPWCAKRELRATELAGLLGQGQRPEPGIVLAGGGTSQKPAFCGEAAVE